MDIKSENPAISSFDYSIEDDDLFLIGDSMLDQYGLVGHHLNSANNFYKHGIRQIITQSYKIEKNIINKKEKTEEDRQIKSIFCEVIPTDVQLLPPTTTEYKSGKNECLFPMEAISREKIYSGTLLLSCTVRAVATLKNGTTIERTDTVNSFKICKVPIIKNSIMCNLYGKSKEALMKLGEDPSDHGGFFIVKNEWSVDCIENMVYNQPKIYINEGYGKYLVRCEFMSKPGDTYQNSDFIIIRYFNDDTITIELSRDKLAGIQIPYYMVFRALGWASDKEMIDRIVFDVEDPANFALNNIIMKSMKAKYKNGNLELYNPVEVIKEIIRMIPEDSFKYLDLKNNPSNMDNAVNEILRIFDTHCLPHIGMTSSSRLDKLKFFGLLIRKTIMVYTRAIPQTDRDSYRNKRIHSAGENYAKSFKTFFNKAVRMPIVRRMMKDFTGSSFSQVNLASIVRDSVFAEDFERLIVQTIVAGNKANLKIKKNIVVNHLTTQLVQRKNPLNTLAIARQVSISSSSTDSAKQSERAAEMRRVHTSALGYICCIHSPPEGEKVGINKQMTIFATIAQASSSEVMKKLLYEDPNIILDENLTPVEISRGGYSRVYVNGFLLGYVSKIIPFIRDYKMKRRRLEINPQTTIYWDNTQNEVHFYVDIGRMIRPLMIVYNNKRDKQFVNTESKTFDQGIAVTQDDITALYQNKKNIEDLLREQKIEYIAPEEQENCYLCPSFDVLRGDRFNELKEYTHCDIPQAILGITALTSPYGNHNPATRIIFQTGHGNKRLKS